MHYKFWVEAITFYSCRPMTLRQHHGDVLVQFGRLKTRLVLLKTECVQIMGTWDLSMIMHAGILVM
jgi:hypothetical protein